MAIEDRGIEVEGVAIQFIVFAVGSFALRVYVRAHMVKAWGWDDWLMTMATITFLFFVSTILAGVVHGIGRRFKDLSEPDIQQALMVSTHTQLTPEKKHGDKSRVSKYTANPPTAHSSGSLATYGTRGP